MNIPEIYVTNSVRNIKKDREKDRKSTLLMKNIAYFSLFVYFIDCMTSLRHGDNKIHFCHDRS